jgi:hypothetical protein
MNIQQLNAIGNDIAQAVKSQWGFDAVLFVAGVDGGNSEAYWAFCFFSLSGLYYPPYSLSRQEVGQMLRVPEWQGRVLLQSLIEEHARFLHGGQRRDGVAGEG